METFIEKNESFNLKDYDKEDSDVFFYKKKIDFNNSIFTLTGTGSHYNKLFLYLYSIGVYCSNIPNNSYTQQESHPSQQASGGGAVGAETPNKTNTHNYTNQILNDGNNKIIILKFYRNIDILSMISILDDAFTKRIDVEQNKNKLFKENILHFEWILKKTIPNGLKQNDELVFEWTNNKINIYIGFNKINTSLDAGHLIFSEKTKQNLVPSTSFKKLGDIEDEDLCKLIFNCYLDKYSITPNIKYSINKFILDI